MMRSVDVEAGVCEPLLVRAREERVEYYMEHGHGVFYILTNASDHHYYQVTFNIPPFPLHLLSEGDDCCQQSTKLLEFLLPTTTRGESDHHTVE